MFRSLGSALVFSLLCATSAADTSYQQLLDAESNGANWLSYSGGYRAERFSPLTQINPSNVETLKVIWAYQMQPTAITGAGLQETTPLVADGIMYLTESPSSVTSLDARTGKLLWHWSPDMSDEVLNIGFPRINRCRAEYALLDNR